MANGNEKLVRIILELINKSPGTATEMEKDVKKLTSALDDYDKTAKKTQKTTKKTANTMKSAGSHANAMAGAVSGNVSSMARLNQAVRQLGQGVKDVDNGFKSFKLTITGLESFFLSQGAAIAVASKGYTALKNSLKEAEKAQGAMIGLASITRFAGEDIGTSMKAAAELSADGLMTLSDAATSLKNLLSRGFNLEEAIQLMKRFKDSAAFGRQASLSLSDAVRSATEGLKNENSILVDNAGVTKNVSKMWEDYAKTIGKGARSLSLAEKRTAEFNGIMEETEGMVGNADAALEMLTGTKAKYDQAVRKLSASFGMALIPAFTQLVNVLTWVMDKGFRPFLAGWEMFTLKVFHGFNKFNKFFSVAPFKWWSKEFQAEIKNLDAALETGLKRIFDKYGGQFDPTKFLAPDTGKRRKEIETNLDETGKVISDTFRKSTEAVKVEIERLKGLYKRGEVETENYFAARRFLAEQLYQTEKKELEALIAVADKETKKKRLRNQIIKKEADYRKELIKIQNEEYVVAEKLKKVKKELEEASKEAEQRITEFKKPVETETEQRARTEMAALQTMQEEELTALQNMTVAKELEAQKQNAIADLQTQHEIELIKLRNKHEKEAIEARLQMNADAAGMLSGLFGDLNSAFGEHTKAFFLLEKAAAIAEAIINTELAATKAMAQGGAVFGISMATLIRAKGMASVAAIAAQTIQGLAEGGPVRGHSPHPKADNVPIQATAGEFMQPVDAVKHYGVGFMEAIRRKLIPKNAFSGFKVPSLIATPGTHFQTGGLVTPANSFAVNVPVSINGMGVGDIERISGTLQTGIEETVINIMRRELS